MHPTLLGLTFIILCDSFLWPVAQTVKNLPAVQGTRVQSLSQEGPRRREATHSSILAWRIPWTEEPGGLQSMELQRVKHHQVTNTFTFHRQKLRSVEVSTLAWVHTASISV